jgi:hypothetical protein
MSTEQAKEFFDDAKNHLHPEQDPVMWNLLNGLSELCDEIHYIKNRIADIKRDLG